MHGEEYIYCLNMHGEEFIYCLHGEIRVGRVCDAIWMESLMACLRYLVTHPRGWSNNPCKCDQRVVVVCYVLCCSAPTVYDPSFSSEDRFIRSSPSTVAIDGTPCADSRFVLITNHHYIHCLFLSFHKNFGSFFRQSQYSLSS